jgi:hypothetical protein
MIFHARSTLAISLTEEVYQNLLRSDFNFVQGDNSFLVDAKLPQDWPTEALDPRLGRSLVGPCPGLIRKAILKQVKTEAESILTELLEDHQVQE